MSAVKKIDEFDEVYANIVRLYDHAENLLNFTTHEDVQDHEAFLAEIEPVVKRIEESANTIADDFATIVERGELPNNAMKRRVSSAMRQVLLVINEYRNNILAKEGEK